jgi:hypothetical protein
MKQILRQRLMEYEWRDQMKAYCKGIIKQEYFIFNIFNIFI